MRGERECRNCKRLQAEVNSLKTRLARLEAEMRHSKRQATPFARNARKPNPKKPGLRQGASGQADTRTYPERPSFAETTFAKHAGDFVHVENDISDLPLDGNLLLGNSNPHFSQIFSQNRFACSNTPSFYKSTLYYTTR